MSRFPPDVDPSRAAVAHAVTSARAALRISSAELGRRATAIAEARGISTRGLSKMALSRLERGAADATASTLHALALALQVPVAQLLPELESASTP